MLSRKAIRDIFHKRENRGAAKRVAEKLGVDQGSVTRWLNGERLNQPRIEAACRAEAERLIKGGPPR
jgi:transcriptional regulator with XRE-family HTH domain